MTYNHLLDNQYHILRAGSHLSKAKHNAADPSAADSLSAMLKSLTLAEHLISRNIRLNDTTPQKDLAQASDDTR
jgi:hypothetical protein